MVSKFESGLMNIVHKLHSAIDEIRNGGENNNGKIDTKKEYDQIANLLAGARQEVGDFFNNNKPDGTMSQQEYNKIKLLTDIVIQETEAAVKTEYGFHPLQDDKPNNVSENKEKKTHVYPDGSYNIQLRIFDDGSYIAKHVDKDGKELGLKLYKNDKEVYANPDFVAKKMDLAKRTKYTIGDQILRHLPFIHHRYTDSLDMIKEGQYYKDYGFSGVYDWDAKTHEFKYHHTSMF